MLDMVMVADITIIITMAINKIVFSF